MTSLTFEVPVKAASTSNLREHWAVKHKRTDAQKAATRRRCPEWKAGPLLVVCLTRVAPRALDDDNLRGALKSVRDAVATWLRVDDRTPLVRWDYAQVKGAEPLVRVDVAWGSDPLVIDSNTSDFLAALSRAGIATAEARAAVSDSLRARLTPATYQPTQRAVKTGHEE
jgi:hypothetical protein